MKYHIIMLMAVLTLAVSGCTTTGTSAKTENASMQWRMTSLEESFLDFRERQKAQAEEQTAFRERMERRIADLEQQIAAGGTMQGGQGDATDAPKEEDWVTDLKPEDEEGWTEVKPEKQAETKPAEKVAESPEPKPWAEVPGQQPQTPKALYDLALKNYWEGKYPASRKLFDSFINKYPANELAANALYWKGETYYSEKDYPQAILTFKEVALKFPKHHKVPDAMLKTGMAYELVGDRDNAVFYLQTLVQDYPDSNAAAKGRERLRALGA
ncbi:tol-pal system protein YbgF [Salidesulfovibrio brasiliensis]|uniref:tol-pal system protein YbgF n=1 Tax=Salidesulfovibrio brasiliensis TaxID=221711 RepID=UPI0006D1BDB6|nr:tol-pal system protein YbgF [Salidesulfovibrio brasiliensis]